MIDRYTVQRILDTAQIVDVVSDFVSLRRAGANYKGLCPFHDDRTPSFMVSPAKNYCKCFACGKGGSPVGFIMEHEQLDYPDALRYLAKKYHIEIEEREQTDEERRLVSERESMYVLNEYALQWFQNQLRDTVDGRAIGMAYYRHRGFRDDIVKEFRLGFSPTKRDAFCQEALAKGYSREVLLKTGLALESQEGGDLRDRFAGRVIFPIFNISGKVCGFGGRVLDAATKGVSVKYQNSPESAVYSKKRELYGMYQAKAHISRENSCYLVEGYTDVMAMHQMGVKNVVASSGTALTTEQIALIHRFTPNIVVVYDGDAAGIKASQRGIDMLLEAGMNVRLLLLPDGDDPDSFARKHSPKEYKEYIESHQVDFINFKTNLLLSEAQNDPVKLSGLVNNIVESISRIPDAITRSTYMKQAAHQLQMDERLVTSAVAKQIKNAEEQKTKYANQGEEQPSESEPKPSDEVKITLPKDNLNMRERELVRMLVRYGEVDMCTIEDENGNERVVTLAEWVHGSMSQDYLQFTEPLHQKILDIALANSQGERQPCDRLFVNHPDTDVSALAFELTTDEEPLSRYHSKNQHIKTDDERLMDIVPLMMSCYKLGIVERELKRMMYELRTPETMADKAKAMELMRNYAELKKIHTVLARECGDRVLL